MSMDQTEPAQAPPPRAALRNPLVASIVVVFAIAVISVALVAANGDEFAKARIPERPRLPVANVAALARDLDRSGGVAAFESFGAPAGEVQVQGTLVDPGPTATAYRLVAAPRGSAEDLADALGFEGDLLSFGGQHRASDGDRALLVSTSGGSHFSFFIGPEAACVAQDDGCSISSGPIGPRGEPLPTSSTSTTRPRARIPERVLVERVVRALRADHGPEQVVPGPGADRTIRIPLLVDGRPAAGWEVSLTFGGDGELRTATGWLGSVRRVDEYPLAGVQVGVERLRTGWPGVIAGMDEGFGRSRPAIGSDTPVAAPGSCPPGRPGCAVSGPATAVDPGSVDPDTPGDDGEEPRRICKPLGDGREICERVDPEPLEPVAPPPPPAPIVLTGVRLGLVLTGDFEQEYLVPAYVFSTQAGTELPVPAIADTEANRTTPFGPLEPEVRPDRGP